MAAESQVRITFLGNAAGAVGAGRQVEGMFSRLGRVAKTVLASLGFAGIITGLVKAGRAAIEFDTGMRNVNSIAGLSEKQLKQLERQVLKLAGPTGQAPKVLAEALYGVVSSGFDAADALTVVGAGAKAATAGLTSAEVATGAITSVLNAYSLGAKDARKVSDVLFATVDKGVLTFEELAGSIGDVLPFAAQLKVPIEAVGAAMATMTLQGLSAAESSTRLKGLLVTMLKPGEDLAGVIRDLGFASGEAMLRQVGLVDSVRLLDGAAKGNKETLATWFPNIRALGGFLSLSGDQLDRFTRLALGMDDATKGAGRTAEVFAEQAKSLSFRWGQAKAALTAAAIPIAQLLFPALVKGAGAVADFAGKVEQALPAIKAGFQGFAQPIAAAVGSAVDAVKRFGAAAASASDDGGRLGEMFPTVTRGAREFAGMFSSAESAGKAFGSMAVGLAAGLVTYKLAAIAASIATIGLGNAIRATPWGLALSLAIGAGTAIGILSRQVEDTATAFDHAAAAVNGYIGVVEGLTDTKGKLRDANLAVEQSELSAQAALQARNSLLVGLSGKEREAAKRSLEYRQAQLGVKQAYADVARAEQARTQLLASMGDAALTAGQKTTEFQRALLDELGTLTELDAKSGLAQVTLEGYVDIARHGTKDMKLWAAAALYLVDATGEIPREIDIMTALSDKDTRRKIKGLIGDVKDLDGQKASPKVDADTRPFNRKTRQARAEVKGLSGETAEPKIKIDAYPALTAIRSVERGLGGIHDKSVTVTVTQIWRGIRRAFAAGGFVPGPDTGGRDAVPAMLAPGELVLNRGQQHALGGPARLARMFGFSTAGVPGAAVQHFATGGFVQGFTRRLKRSAARDRKNSGYKAKLKAVERLQHRLDSNRDRQDRLDRSIGQDERETSISVEEFITVDGDGNETLNTAAVQQRLAEIDRLVTRRNELIALIDEETGILTQLITALDQAVKAYQAEIRDQQRVIREMTGIIHDATAKMRTAPEEAQPGYQRIIDTAERRRDNARSKITELQGLVETARGDRSAFRRERLDQPLDRRDQELTVAEYQAERAEVQAVKPNPREPTSSDVTDSTDTGAAAGESGPDMQAFIDELQRQLAQLRLALGIQEVQLPIIGSFARGSIHVPETGLALVHAGERITPAAVRGGDGGSIDDVKVVVNIAEGMRWLERFIDVRVERGAGAVASRLGREADRVARAGESGALSAPYRRL